MAAYDRLSAQDRSFLDLEEPNTHMHVAGAFLFEGGPLSSGGGLDIDKLRAYVTSRLHLIPRYRQRLEWIPLENHPVWVDDDRFNIDYHVRHTCLPQPGDEELLKRLCGRIMSQALDRAKPLWEIWVVEGLEHDRFALVTKTHHCMVDGVSGSELLQVLLSPDAEKEVEAGPTWVPQPRPGGLTLVRDAALRRAQLPLRFAGAALETLRAPRRTREHAREVFQGLRASLATAIRPASDSPFNRAIGPHRRFDWLAFDLDGVKRVKNQLGGTVNDVVLATVAGAVGRFLLQRGIPEARQRDLDFRAFCPVDLRSSAERGTLGNRVSALIAQLPVAERDPRRRLQAVSEMTRALKHSKQALGAEILASAGEWLTPTLTSMAARLAFRRPPSNMVVTNVPGPQMPLYLLGSRMTESYPLVPLFHNQALGVALLSYAGGLYWGFNADWDLMPDLRDFVVATDASFRELCEAADR